MFPGFGYKQPYPQSMPPQMKASNSPFTHETWPNHYGYPVPPQCHSCCNHNPPYPNYYPYMPHPYAHLPSPPPVHPQCYYPVYPGPSPFQYCPPPHYTMELPKYEYDKTVPHCHGCNNLCKDQGVKIEEHEPEAQNNKPVAWVPFDYLKSQERPSESTKSRGDGERDSKLSGWMPLDIESLKRLLQNGRKAEDDETKNQVSQMPFPMVWLPYNNEERGQKSLPAVVDEGKDGEKLSVEKRDKPPKTAAVKHEDDRPKNQVHQTPFPFVFLPFNNEEEGQKSIPGVKNGEKSSVEKRDKPVRTITVKPLDQTDGAKAGNGFKAKEDEKKSAEKDIKSKPSSPTKASKLPPICLRIDPLPKKKNGEGKSRSPSPPRDKARPVEVVKPSSSLSSKSPKKKNDEGKPRSLSPPVEVVNPSSSPAAAAEKDVVEVNTPSRLEGKLTELKQEVEQEKEKKPEKKMLSGEEAATIIQSAYRGYEVRRWEPVKKMRQIAKIQEEAAGLKKSIEASVGSMDPKQKTALGENIMSLLLKLDTIQGLHSSIRDIRKSVARELVNLQEMLDAIVIKQPEHSPEETITPGPASEKDDFGMSEDESKSLQRDDESFLSSSLSRNEDHSEVEIEENTEGKTCSLPQVPSMQEDSCAVEELESSEVTHEQATDPKEVRTKSVGDNEIDAEGDSEIKNVATLELKPVESHADSADQIGMDLHLPDGLHVSVKEEEGAKALTEVAEDVVIESDEASKEVEFASSEKVQEESDGNATELVKFETQVVNEDAEEVKLVSTESNQAKEDEKQVQCNVTEPVKVQVQEDDEAEVAEEVKLVSTENTKANEDESQMSETQVNGEAEDAEEVKLASTGSTKAKENESQVQEEFDTCVSEMVKAETQENDEAQEPEEVKLTIYSTETKDEDKVRAMEDMEKMRDLLEKMVESGKKQQEVVCSLNQKIKELEGKLAKQKEMKNKKKKKARVSLRRGPSSKRSSMALPS